mmetsp:Transcript_9077/g.30263  ORF Transcript_9077/g.30263 Transcript_9077/m.30263 type:complete len:370 (+) Transcript_9077:496-1605(+)
MAEGSRSTSAARTWCFCSLETWSGFLSTPPKNGSSLLICRTTPILGVVAGDSPSPKPSPSRKAFPSASSPEDESSSSHRTTGLVLPVGFCPELWPGSSASRSPSIARSSSPLSPSPLSSSQSRPPNASFSCRRSPCRALLGLRAKKSSSTGGPTSGCSPPPTIPAVGPEARKSVSSMFSPPNAAADAPPLPARCENCGGVFSRAAGSKFPFGFVFIPSVSRLARRLTLSLAFAAISPGVIDATAVTPLISELNAAEPSKIGASPKVVRESRSHVMLASSALAGAAVWRVALSSSEAVTPSFPCSSEPPPAPVAFSIRRSYSSYLSPFTVFRASCACTTPAVFKTSACSKLARFKHRNGMCRNVESACRP